MITSYKQGLYSLLIRLSNMNEEQTEHLQSTEIGGV